MKFAEQTQPFETTAFMDMIARLMDAVTNQMRNRWVCFYRDGFVFALCGFIRADFQRGQSPLLTHQQQPLRKAASSSRMSRGNAAVHVIRLPDCSG